MKKFFNKPSVCILLSVVLMVLCFLMNRYFKVEQAPWSLLQYALTIFLVIFSFTGLFKGISQVMTGRGKKVTAPVSDPEHPIKIWNHEELFAYLEKEDIIDLDIDHPVVRRIGTVADIRRDKRAGKDVLFNKAYYINEQEYASLAEFKEQFAAAHPEQEVRILRASIDEGSMEVKLP